MGDRNQGGFKDAVNVQVILRCRCVHQSDVRMRVDDALGDDLGIVQAFNLASGDAGPAASRSWRLALLRLYRWWSPTRRSSSCKALLASIWAARSITTRCLRLSRYLFTCRSPKQIVSPSVKRHPKCLWYAGFWSRLEPRKALQRCNCSYSV